jgi:hypothetical protein
MCGHYAKTSGQEAKAIQDETAACGESGSPNQERIGDAGCSGANFAFSPMLLRDVWSFFDLPEIPPLQNGLCRAQPAVCQLLGVDMLAILG